MRTKKDDLYSMQVISNYGPSNPAAWGALVAVLHDLVDRLPDDDDIMPNDDDTLRTALTKLADDRDTMCRSCARDLRALLAAHPAPETVGHVCTPHCDAERGHYPAPVPDSTGHEYIGVAGHPDDDECTYRADGTDRTYCGARRESHYPAPAPDTRREVAREIDPEAFDDWPPEEVARYGSVRDFRQRRALGQADAVLAVLPAPPVVDEAEIAEVLARHRTWGPVTLTCHCGEDLSNGPTDRIDDNHRHHQAAAVAARLRGATRG